MKKPLLSLMLCLALLFNLCACGAQTAAASTAQETADSTAAASPAAAEPTAEPTPTPSPTAEPTPSPTPEPTPRPLLEPELTDYAIDPSFFEPADEQGTVVTAEYVTHDYLYGPQDEYTKGMRVYLPYGYDESQSYDVLFLAHVASCNEYFWLDSTHPYEHPVAGTINVSVPTLLDNMIERGLCRPLIVIALNCYITEGASWEHNSERDYYQFPIEFRNDIMPAVQAQFAVYEGREHYGFLGASFGAYVDKNCILDDCFDLVGWHCQTGGGEIDPYLVRESQAAIGAQDLPLYCLYICEGDHDDIGPVQNGIYALEGAGTENLQVTFIQGAGHDYREWDTALYNALQLFFRE